MAASSKLPVTLTASGGCTEVDAVQHVFVAERVGSCTVTATQPGNEVFLPADPVQRTVQIVKAATTVSFGNTTFEYLGENAFPLTASATSKASVSYTVVTDGCEVSGSVLSVVDTGGFPQFCGVTATAGATDQYEGASSSETITINPTNLTMSWEPRAPEGLVVRGVITVNRPWGIETSISAGSCTVEPEYDYDEITSHEVTITFSGYGSCTLYSTVGILDGSHTTPELSEEVTINAPT